MSSVKTRKNSPRAPQRGRLRRNVGLVILNEEGRVLAGLRSHANGDRAWQLPQGGIEGREKPLTAAYREIKEETGLTREHLKLVQELPGWTVYYLPRDWQPGRHFVGQRQKWFVFKYTGQGLPDLGRAEHHEFSELDWLEAGWLAEHVIDFRKKVYREVFGKLGLIRNS